MRVFFPGWLREQTQGSRPYLERRSIALNALTNGLSREVVSLHPEGELDYRISVDSRDSLHRRINDVYRAMKTDQQRSRESIPRSPAF